MRSSFFWRTSNRQISSITTIISKIESSSCEESMFTWDLSSYLGRSRSLGNDTSPESPTIHWLCWIGEDYHRAHNCSSIQYLSLAKRTYHFGKRFLVLASIRVDKAVHSYHLHDCISAGFLMKAVCGRSKQLESLTWFITVHVRSWKPSWLPLEIETHSRQWTWLPYWPI